MTQILKKYSTLSAADNDWRMVRRPNDVALNGYVLVRELQFTDAMYADDFVALLDAQTTITNPVVDGQTWTGTYANSKVTPKQGAFDSRSITIENELVKLSSVSAIADLIALPLRETGKHEILNLFEFETGEGESQAYVWDRINQSSKDALRALTDADLVIRLPLIGDTTDWANSTAYAVGAAVISGTTAYFCITAHTSSDAPAVFADDAANWRAYGLAWATGTEYKADEVVVEEGIYYQAQSDHTADASFLVDLAAGKWRVYWNYLDRGFNDGENGDTQFAVQLKIADWDKSWSNKRLAAYQNPDGISKKKSYEVDGVPAARAETVRAAITAEASHALASTAIQYTGDGKVRISSTQVPENSKTSGDVEIEYVPGIGKNRERITVRWFDITAADSALIVTDAKTNKADMSASSYEAAGSGHTLKSIRPMPHDADSLYDVVRVTENTQDVSIFDDWDNFHDEYDYNETRYRRVKISGVLKDESRTWNWGVYVLQTTSRTKAYTFASGELTSIISGTDSITGAPYADFIPDKRPVIQPFAGGRYRVVVIKLISSGSWA